MTSPAMNPVSTTAISNAGSQATADRMVTKLAAVLPRHMKAIAWSVGGSLDVGVQHPVHMDSAEVISDVAMWLLQAEPAS